MVGWEVLAAHDTIWGTALLVGAIGAHLHMTVAATGGL
jgi:hypothetical protein